MYGFAVVHVCGVAAVKTPFVSTDPVVQPFVIFADETFCVGFTPESPTPRDEPLSQTSMFRASRKTGSAEFVSVMPPWFLKQTFPSV